MDDPRVKQKYIDTIREAFSQVSEGKIPGASEMRILISLSCLLLFTACAESDSGTVAAGEPPFFTADRNATGPLTLAELTINIPEEIDKGLSESRRSCFLEAIERRARTAGDPAELDPENFPYWGGEVDRASWSKHSKYMQRILLGQAIISWAMSDC